MTELFSAGLRLKGHSLSVLDQRLLPQNEVWVTCESIDHMIDMIKTLHVRGAPLIGVAAGLALATEAMKDEARGQGQRWTYSHAQAEALRLRAARPTAVNLMNVLDRLVLEKKEAKWNPMMMCEDAIAIFKEDVDLCERMAAHGAALVKDGEGILTHCNAGALATVGRGTAVGVITKAFEDGKKIHVYVDETRPLLQGARLTAWELEKAKVPYTLICDNMAASLMRAGKIQRVFVGADRIAMNGDFANKIGTYNVAVLAKHHNVAFHPVAPYTTVDLAARTGRDIPIEERDASEVKGFKGASGTVSWAPEGAKTFNPSFDVTPNELVTSLILDRGVFTQKELEDGKLQKALL